MTIHNFIVDSSIYPNKGNFTLNLTTPIIIKEKEKLKFKLINFSSLNNIYNISPDLNNNTFNVKIFKRLMVWSVNPAGTISQMIKQTDIAPYYNSTTNLPIDSGHVSLIVNNVGNFVEKISMSDYYLYLRDYRITTATSTPSTRYFYNVFLDSLTTDISKMIPVFDTVALNISKDMTIQRRTGETEQLNKVQVSIYYNTNGLYNNVAGTITGTVYGMDILTNITQIGTATISYTTAMLISNNIQLMNIIVTANPNNRYLAYHIKYTGTGFDSLTSNRFYFNKVNFIKNDWGYFTNQGQAPQFYTENNITIPSGSYSSTTLFSKLNSLMVEYFMPNTKFSLQLHNYKTVITNTDTLNVSSEYDYNAVFYFTFPTKLNAMIGFNNVISNIITVGRGTATESTNSINLLNFQKYLITTSLKLANAPQLFLKDTEYRAEGIGDVIAVINKDIAPFQYINYINTENIYYDIDNKVINNISFKILNEFKQALPTISGCTLQFQIITSKK